VCCRAREAVCSSATSAARDAGDFVRGNAHAQAGRADQDAEVRLGIGHTLADGLRESG